MEKKDVLEKLKTKREKLEGQIEEIDIIIEAIDDQTKIKDYGE